MHRVIGVLVCSVLAGGCAQSSAAPALAAALSHVRTIAPDGHVVVAVDTVSTGEVEPREGSEAPDTSIVRAAANLADFPAVRTHEAITCEASGICRPNESIHGLVHVIDVLRLGADSMSVQLRTLRFGRFGADVYEQVDVVTVRRMPSAADWRIYRIDNISKS